MWVPGTEPKNPVFLVDEPSFQPLTFIFFAVLEIEHRTCGVPSLGYILPEPFTFETGSCSVAQAGFELVNCLPQLPGLTGLSPQTQLSI